MATKNWLTVFHCFVAVGVYLVGLTWASSIKEIYPVGAFPVFLGSLLMPIIIATRVSWASGYAAGRGESRTLPPLHQSRNISN
jgi:hypothetical protein